LEKEFVDLNQSTNTNLNKKYYLLKSEFQITLILPILRKGSKNDFCVKFPNFLKILRVLQPTTTFPYVTPTTIVPYHLLLNLIPKYSEQKSGGCY